MAAFQRRGGSWTAVVRRKGHPSQTKTFPTKVAAEKWARKVESEIDAGKFQSTVDIPLAEVVERYKNEVCPHRNGGRWEQIRLTKLMKNPLLKINLRQVTPQTIKRWRDDRLREVSTASVNREMNLLSGMFSHFVREWELMGNNPMKGVSRPTQPKHRRRRISAEELGRLTAYFGLNKSTFCRVQDYIPPMFEFAIETGMRMGEIAALEWKDVHKDWVYVAKSKNGDAREVPLSQRAQEILKTLPQHEARVFPVNTGTVGVYFREACKKTGIVDLHFHDARHEAASRLANKVSVLELAKILGHRDLKSLMVYYNPTASELAQKLNQGSV